MKIICKCGKELFFTSKEVNASLKNYPRVTEWIYTVNKHKCIKKESPNAK